MRLRRLINRGSAISLSLSLSLLAICASEAHAQGGGAGGGGGGGGGGGAGGGGGGASTATATQAGGGYTGGGSSSSGFTGSTGMSAAQRNAGGTATLAPTTGNFLQQTYYSPYLAGLVNTNGQALSGVNSSFGQPGYTTVYSTATSSSSGTSTSPAGGVIASTMISGGVGFGYNTYGLGRTYNYVAVPGDTLPPVVHSNPVLRATIEDALQRSTTFKPLAPLQVAVNDSEVILDGTVASAREKRIIEGMIRMTPGVRSVVNRLEIAEKLPLPKVGSAGGGP